MTAREPAIRLVRQRGGVDCGVACLAMICSVRYREALSVVGHLGDWGMNTAHLEFAATKLGVCLVERETQPSPKTLRMLPTGVLLFVFYGCANPHFAVWDAGARRLFDPALLIPLQEARAVARLTRYECRLRTICEVFNATP